MRKLFSIVCGLFVFSAVALAAQEPVEASQESAQSEQTVPAEGWHPYKEVANPSKDFSNWSLTFEGGFNIFDGDFVQKEGSLFPASLFRPTGGLSLTYDFTPAWGLTGSYLFLPYGTYVGKEGSLNTNQVAGQMHTLSLFLNYNLANAWFPQRQKNIFSLYLLAGMGMGIYNYDYYSPETGGIVHPRPGGDKYATTGVMSIGGAAEFNVGRSVSLGLKAVYQIYTTDKLESKIEGANNDCIEYATLYLRWKIDAKRKSHIRNISAAVYDDIASSKNPQIQKPAVKDTLYISSTDTIFSMPSDDRLATAVGAIVDDKLSNLHTAPQYYYAYFDIAKYELTDGGLQAIQQLAAQLQADSTLCVEVSGFCDNTGSDDYNRKLGQHRAERVIKELTSVYGISEERIVSTYKGIVKNVDSSYSPNRRVEMRLISKEELDELKKAEPQQVVAEDTLLKEHAILETVISDSNTTFARLAARYYDNVYCWPYIYAANRKVARNDNPDFIFTDEKIVIPQLSQEEINGAHAGTVEMMIATIRK